MKKSLVALFLFFSLAVNANEKVESAFAIPDSIFLLVKKYVQVNCGEMQTLKLYKYWLQEESNEIEIFDQKKEKKQNFFQIQLPLLDHLIPEKGKPK